MTELCDIALKYGTDKCPEIKHHFTLFYYDMFKDSRTSIKKVLEVGIGKMAPLFMRGASLYMWRDWFTQAQIYGADIDPTLIFDDDRISTFLCDQTKEEDLKRVIAQTGSDIDLFIDDGSHLPEHQIFTCLTVMPLLDNPIYVIEDVGHREIVEKLGDYDCKILKLSRRKYNDDCMVVVRKRSTNG